MIKTKFPSEVFTLYLSTIMFFPRNPDKVNRYMCANRKNRTFRKLQFVFVYTILNNCIVVISNNLGVCIAYTLSISQIKQQASALRTCRYAISGCSSNIFRISSSTSSSPTSCVTAIICNAS